MYLGVHPQCLILVPIGIRVRNGGYVGTEHFFGHNLTLTLTVPLPSMNLALNHYHTISRKISFAENLHNLALIQPGKSRSDGVVQEHIAAASIGPPCISSDYLVKEVEEEMDFADVLTSFNQPTLTKMDLLLEKELLG